MITKEQKSILLIRDWYNKYKNHIVVTTSCGATSSVLIDLVNKSKCDIPIVFIDTRFLFKETLEYFLKLKTIYKSLTFIKLKNNDNKEQYYDTYNNQINIVDIDKCCFNNKVNILNNFLKEKDIKCWISAIRKDQNDIRNCMDEVEFKDSRNIYKILPIFNWSQQDVDEYIKRNNLSVHPLKDMGYESIGCQPCTRIGKNREGRWASKEKIECGLHL